MAWLEMGELLVLLVGELVWWCGLTVEHFSERRDTFATTEKHCCASSTCDVLGVAVVAEHDEPSQPELATSVVQVGLRPSLSENSACARPCR